MNTRKNNNPANRWNHWAKKSSSSEDVDLMTMLAIDIAVWTASGIGQSPCSQYLHQVSFEQANGEEPMQFSHVCDGAEGVISFSFMFLLSFMEDCNPRRVIFDVKDGVFEATFEDEVTISMSFTALL